MVYFKENCNFPRFQRGSIIFQGEGPNFLQGEGQLLIPYAHISASARVRFLRF